MPQPRLPLTLPPFATARVLIVGDVMLDRYWRGPCRRISPEAPVPVVKVASRDDRPGGAANVAVNIASLGGRASLLCVTGIDEAAQALQHCLDAHRVDYDFIQLEQAATITKLRVLSHNQQMLRLDFEDGFPGFDKTLLVNRFQQHLRANDVVVLSDYAKGTLAELCQPLIAEVSAAGGTVLVDPKGTDFSRYRGADLLTPNWQEFQAEVGSCRDQAELVAKAETLRAALELQALLVTRGEHGMLVVQRNQAAVQLPTQAREVYDVTGAGDTVIAVLAAALAAGTPLLEAATLANLAAGIVVGKLGTASVSPSELRQALQPPPPIHRTAAVFDEEGLLTAVQRARQRGETIVMTNGCFDILHAGHVGYLQQARQLGDRLIVAVNDDASTRRLKGPQRPINPLPARLQVLAGLSTVDWLIPFSEDTPERLICRLLPDVLVKGGDYQVEQIAGGRCVREAGGEVVILDYLPGYSTSATIARLQAREKT